MEPREADLKQIPQFRPDEKKRRFRIVKLEDRIAPKGCSSASDFPGGCGGGGNCTYTCNPGHCKPL